MILMLDGDVVTFDVTVLVLVFVLTLTLTVLFLCTLFIFRDVLFCGLLFIVSILPTLPNIGWVGVTVFVFVFVFVLEFDFRFV